MPMKGKTLTLTEKIFAALVIAGGIIALGIVLFDLWQ